MAALSYLNLIELIVDIDSFKNLAGAKRFDGYQNERNLASLYSL